MLLNPRLAGKGSGNNRGGPMIAVTDEVFQFNICIRQRFFDHALNFAGIHGHSFVL
jgi:hypothetical protein